MKKFEFLEHTADIKFRAYGKTFNRLFENSVLAVSDVLSRNQKIKSKTKRNFSSKGKDYEKLLYKMIEEVIYLFDADNFIVSKAHVDFDEKNEKLNLVFYGDESKNYSGLDHIKSVTYNEMFVKKEKSFWVSQVVLDM